MEKGGFTPTKQTRLEVFRPTLHHRYLVVLTLVSLGLGLAHFLLNPFRAVASDEIAYYTSALDLADHGTLNARLLYYESLVENELPMKEPHLPGFVLVVGGFIKLLSPDESSVKVINYLFMWLATLLLFHLLYRHHDVPHRLALYLTLLFAAYPIINLNNVMPEPAVVCSNLVMAYFLLYRMPSSGGVWVLAGAVGASLLAILIRPNAIFLLPCALLCISRRRAALRYALFLGCLAACIYALRPLLEDRMVYPGSFLHALADQPSVGGALSLVLQNLGQNLSNVFVFGSPPFTLYKLDFYALVAVSLLLLPFGFRANWRVSASIVAYFLINTAMLLLFYDNHDWRFLRASVQFVPLLLIVAALGLSALGPFFKARAWIVLGIAILLIQGASSVFFYREFTEVCRGLDASRRENPVEAEIRARLARSDEPLYVISDYPYLRFALDYPRSTCAFISNPQEFNRENLEKILRHYPLNCLILGPSSLASSRGWLAELGFESTATIGSGLEILRRS